MHYQEPANHKVQQNLEEVKDIYLKVNHYKDLRSLPCCNKEFLDTLLIQNEYKLSSLLGELEKSGLKVSDVKNYLEAQLEDFEED